MTPPPRRRADAAGNRVRIVETARALLATTDDLKLNAVATQAGVGQGTLYRHFPTRADLLAEVYRQDVEALVSSAPRLLEQHQPLEALGLWFDRVAEYAQIKRGVFAAVEVAVRQDLSVHSLGPIGDALSLLLDAGKAAGTIRLDADARDVIVLISYLSRIDHDEARRARRPLAIILDGLRPRGPAASG